MRRKCAPWLLDSVRLWQEPEPWGFLRPLCDGCTWLARPCVSYERQGAGCKLQVVSGGGWGGVGGGGGRRVGPHGVRQPHAQGHAHAQAAAACEGTCTGAVGQ